MICLGIYGEAEGKIIESFEGLLFRIKPYFKVLYVDSNSNLAEAMVAFKIHISIIYIKTG